MHFAAQLAGPISGLVGAAERVRAGDLSARVPEGERDDELGSLSRAFNRMTNQIESQQRELIEANRQLDERRRFTETVLTGVSAGVIGLDRERPDQPAEPLRLGICSASISTEAIGEDLADVAPEMAELLERGGAAPGPAGARRRSRSPAGTAPARCWSASPPSTIGDEISGFVVTFDDITELLSAQRKAAWADVARRIAHEIKNPLTPIQLSAERLRRKYLKEIKNDPETFKICTDTIVRHVERYRADGRRILVLRADAGAGDEARESERDRRAGGVPASAPRIPRSRSRPLRRRSRCRCAAMPGWSARR